MKSFLRACCLVIPILLLVFLETAPGEVELAAFVEESCLDCHHSGRKRGGLDLERMDGAALTENRDVWEKVLLRLRARQMPPASRKERPTEEEYEAVVRWLETSLDAVVADSPDPGRTETFRRLTRTEYGNVIRDLLDIEIDAADLLPKDESSHGFDNITVAGLSPTLMERYVSAAQKISRQAIGSPTSAPEGKTFRIRPDVTQESHVEGLPLGTRGGLLIPYTFPRTGAYEITIRLARDRNEHVEGLRREHSLEVLMNRERVARFAIHPPKNEGEHQTADAHLTTRVQVEAGPRDVGVTFVNDATSLLESKRQPFEAHYNMHRHPRLTPAIYQVSITGPHGEGESGHTPSRDKIFVSYPSGPEEEDVCAEAILRNLMQRATRRPVTDEALARPLSFYQETAREQGFEAGIEMALSAILVSPEFLFRIERDPADLPPKTAYALSDVELASRLSFFLWSSMPDERLLDVAMIGKLNDPAELEAQVARLLADRRADALVENFAGQWLQLRNLEAITPDLRLFPDFDDNLRQALRKETELFIASVLRADRPIHELLTAKHTFLNERLAKHYDIPHVYGSRFRRVALEEGSRRGGLLRQGSILTVTSYATRTSPVIRGNWVLENILGTPAPPPPPDIPALDDVVVSASLPMRERLAAHRADSACASCHDLMDPIGFSLENFDAVGRWRSLEDGVPVDSSGGLPDGRVFAGVEPLLEGLVVRPELFAGVITEKLMTYALGRGVDYRDAPAIRKIVRDAAREDYRFSAIVRGIVQSQPFTMRMTP